ncbi:MAG TPA: twin-arginine translocation signal domain-containing protein, partial [Lacipirellulaceae bacterium]|nr:twin-arginine translocation signal domain-containing protein [Lacipirellulaceae bacterium]
MKRINTITRREFIGRTATASAALIVPSYVLGRTADSAAPSDKLNIAGIGIGGQGASDLAEMESENIVALCDVD